MDMLSLYCTCLSHIKFCSVLFCSLLDKMIFHAAAHLWSTRALSLRNKTIAYPSANVMVKM